MSVSGTGIWSEQMGGAFGLALRRDAGQAVGEVRRSGLGMVDTYRILGSPQMLRRTRQAISRSEDPPLKVCALRSGSLRLSRDRAPELRVTAGQIVFYDTAQPYELDLDGRWDCDVMTVSREDLALPERTLRTALEHPLPGPGAGNVLTQLIRTSLEQGRGSRISSALLGHAAVDLLAGLAYENEAPQAPDEAVRAAVLAYIREHLGAPDLDVPHLAKVHRVSVRTLHRIFRDERWGVAETIRNLRLDAVRRDFADPRLRSRGIMAIGARYGFRDQAHLTRAYRTRFGITPAASRRELQGGD